MKIKTLILCVGIISFVGCSSKSIVNKVDEETRADIRKIIVTGNKLEADMVRSKKDTSGTLKKSIISKKK